MAITQPVARTAFYCCLIRADDAASAKPVCGDTFAGRFVDEDIRRQLAPLLRLKEPAASNVARHRLIDDLVRARLSRDPHTRVILIGAGFDTRAYRLEGGQYIEIDDPQLIAYKETRLPAREAPNPITRILVTFADTTADAFLAPLAGDDEALVILEGVSMYLSDDTLRRLATALVHALPRATVVCDLMSNRFARKAGGRLRAALSGMGVQFAAHGRHPSEWVMEAGYRPVERQSIVDRAREAGTLPIPRWLLNTLFRELRDGYQVWVFAPPPA